MIKHFVYSFSKVVLVLMMSPIAFATSHTVIMKSLSYDPKSISIKAGDTIEWINKSYTEHSATGEQFETGLVQPQKTSKKIEFKTPGSYSYHCSVHGKTMSGQVVVSQ